MSSVEGNKKVGNEYFTVKDYTEVYERESKHNNPDKEQEDIIISIKCELCGAFTLKWDDEIINCRYCGELV